MQVAEDTRWMLGPSASWKTHLEQAKTPDTFDTQQMQKTASQYGFQGLPWFHVLCWLYPGPSCSQQGSGSRIGPPLWKRGSR